MSCFLKTEDGKTRAILTFKRSQLMYDIENCAYIEGCVVEGEIGDHRRHMIQDVGNEGNADRVTRVLDLGVAKCREKLYSLTKHDVHRPELDDRLVETDVYGIVLNVPDGFSQTTLNYLEKLIHEYLVYIVMEDWLGITNPTKSDTWKEKQLNIEREIQGCLNTRTGRARIRLNPFG